MYQEDAQLFSVPNHLFNKGMLNVFNPHLATY